MISRRKTFSTAILYWLQPLPLIAIDTAKTLPWFHKRERHMETTNAHNDTSADGKTLNPTLVQFACAWPSAKATSQVRPATEKWATQKRAIVPTSRSTVLADTEIDWIERSANSVGRPRRPRIDRESWIKYAFQKHWLQAGDSPTLSIFKKRCAFAREWSK